MWKIVSPYARHSTFLPPVSLPCYPPTPSLPTFQDHSNPWDKHLLHSACLPPAEHLSKTPVVAKFTYSILMPITQIFFLVVDICRLSKLKIVSFFAYLRSPTVSPPPESLPYPLLHCEFRVPLRSTICTWFTFPLTELSSI